MRYFDYRKDAAEAGISAKDLRSLERMVGQDFPEDPMMFELHMLRACRAVRDGRMELADALAPRLADAPR